MRIGIDARLWNQTGVGRYLRNLVINLEKIDKKNHYVLFVRKEDKVEIRSGNFELFYTDIPWHSFSEQFKFWRVLNKNNLDLVHFPYISAPLFYNKPFVLTIHDLIPYHYPTGRASTLPLPFYGIKLLVYRFLIRNLAGRAKNIIVPSAQTKKEVEKNLNINPGKISVTYEAVDEKLIKKNLKKKPFFLYVGNAYPHKNLERLIRVFNRLKSVKLVLAGKDDYFYKRLKNKVSQNIKFANDVSDNKLSQLYSEAKYFISPSLMEGFGLPVLEAMANGCIALISDIPVFREIADGSAVYFDPNRDDEIYKKVLSVFGNDFDERKTVEDEFRAAKKFSWEKTARQTLKIYESSISLR